MGEAGKNMFFPAFLRSFFARFPCPTLPTHRIGVMADDARSGEPVTAA